MENESKSTEHRAWQVASRHVPAVLICVTLIIGLHGMPGISTISYMHMFMLITNCKVLWKLVRQNQWHIQKKKSGP